MKVEKVMKRLNNIEGNASEGDNEDDRELALITKSIKKFWKKPASKEGSSRNYGRNSSKEPQNVKDMEGFHFHKRGHYSNKCLRKEESEKKKEKAMIVASWGDSNSDVDYEEQKIRSLLAEKEKVCDTQTLLRTTVFDLKKIVDFQTETIKEKEDIVELQYNIM